MTESLLLLFMMLMVHLRMLSVKMMRLKNMWIAGNINSTCILKLLIVSLINSFNYEFFMSDIFLHVKLLGEFLVFQYILESLLWRDYIFICQDNTVFFMKMMMI